MLQNELQIVVVDDLRDAAQALADLLALDGCQVRIACDGQEALEVIEACQPHCVLLDVDMPGMDGSQLARRLRERYGDAIVLIAVTGWSPLDVRVSTAFVRVDHYLMKPINPAVLRKLLNIECH